jgi:hypothetical protein
MMNMNLSVFTFLKARYNGLTMGLLKGKFFKEFLGILFFDDAVDIDIHKEEKNKITTKFKEKRRLSMVPQ